MTALVVALLLRANTACAADEPFPAATPESQGLSAQSLDQLLDAVRGFAEKGDIVGGELLVIKNRRTVLHETVGLADRENQKALKSDAIFCIRSMTKTVVGAAVQILIDEGRLSLDDTAARYLPSFDNDKSRGITVRQLLTHTGGLPFSSFEGVDFRKFGNMRGVADLSGRNGPTVPPGTRFQYSDDGANTLGAIVSEITGQPAEAFITKRILEPIGMSDTFPLVSTAGDKLDRFIPSYMGRRDNWVRLWSPPDKPLFPYFLGSAGMYSTTRDYARFLAMYLDGGLSGANRVLSQAAVERTLTPAVAARTSTGFPGLSMHCGQLMFDYVDADKKVLAFGHSGSDGTWAWVWPGRDLIVLYFTQSRGNLTGVELESVIDRTLLGGTAPASVAQEMTEEAAAPFLGMYAYGPQQKPIFVVLERDRLAIEIPWRALAELKKEPEPNVWSFAGAPQNSVKFHRDGEGSATALDLRSGDTRTLPRFKPDESLPSLDELFARRGERQRGEKLGALGVTRLSGTVAVAHANAQDKETFEFLAAGDDHYRLKVSRDGAETQLIVAGDRAWSQPVASSPVRELPEAMVKESQRTGWMSEIGDWRGGFGPARVLKRTELDGQPVFLIHAAPEKGRQRLIYLDAESGLARGYDEVRAVPAMGLVGCEVRFTDYREIEGVQIPFKRTVKYSTPKLGTRIYQVEKIETRLQFAEDPFNIK